MLRGLMAIDRRLEAIAGQPLAVLPTSSGAVDLTPVSGLDLAGSRTLYTVFTIHRPPSLGGLATLMTYGTSPLSDSVPNTYLTLRMNTRASDGRMTAQTRVTGGGGPTTLLGELGKHVVTWGLDVPTSEGAARPFVGVDGGAIASVVVPAQSIAHERFRVDASASTFYGPEMLTIVYRGLHTPLQRARIEAVLMRHTLLPQQFAKAPDYAPLIDSAPTATASVVAGETGPTAEPIYRLTRSASPAGWGAYHTFKLPFRVPAGRQIRVSYHARASQNVNGVTNSVTNNSASAVVANLPYVNIGTAFQRFVGTGTAVIDAETNIQTFRMNMPTSMPAGAWIDATGVAVELLPAGPEIINRINNPHAKNNRNGWGAGYGSGGAGVSGPVPDWGGGFRLTWTTGNTPPVLGGIYLGTGSRIPAEAGRSYFVKLKLRSSVTQGVAIIVEQYDASGTRIGTNQIIGTLQLQPDATRLFGGFVTPIEGTAAVTITAYAHSAANGIPWPAGSVYDVDEAMFAILPVGMTTTRYLDGDSPGWAWTGPAHASPSVGLPIP